jgi:hypothetical protein
MSGRLLLIVAAAFGLLACAGSDDGAPTAADCDAFEGEVDREWIDLCVRLNQIQVLGTHNSYHVQPSPELFGLLNGFSADLARGFEYTHRPLDEQLDRGMRQFELDVFADPEGGLYADPAGQRLAPGPPFDPEDKLGKPGLKVLHVQDVDFRSTCVTLVECLSTIAGWSRDHPDHVPLLVLVELKNAPIADPLKLGFVTPHPFGPAELDGLDAEIRSVFDDDHLLTPDDVRGRSATLAAAITERGWPALGDVRGKVLFALDNTGPPRDLYLEGAPSLEGRVLFVSSEPPAPSAAFVKLNDPLVDRAKIEQLVGAGLVIRTRADANTVQARTGDAAQRDAALASGAQWVSTDYPEPSPFGTGYVVRMPGDATIRCNPIRTWDACRSELLEPAE